MPQYFHNKCFVVLKKPARVFRTIGMPLKAKLKELSKLSNCYSKATFVFLGLPNEKHFPVNTRHRVELKGRKRYFNPQMIKFVLWLKDPPVLPQ